MDSLAILLLTGGYSRRMGQNKANLKIDDRTFAEKIASELSSCGPLYLSVSEDISPDFPSDTDYPRIVDEIPHIGPLGGISAAMHRINADTFFVCACDMPRMNAAFVRRLMQIRNQFGNPDALLVRNQSGRIYTTAGIYHRSILPKIEKQIREKNYRLRDLLIKSNVFYVDEESLGELKNCLDNINTMKDYQKLLKNPIL